MSASIPELRQKAFEGDIEAQYRLALTLSKQSNDAALISEARSWHETAAEAGHLKAKTAWALFLLQGWGGPADENRALQLLQESAADSEPLALLNLANLYEKGQLVEQSFQKAEDLYLQASESGLIEADIRLGELYFHPRGETPPDYKRALPFFQKAANRGLPEAQNYLGVMHEFGYGLEPDREKAREFYELAAWQDLARAQGNLGNLLRFGPPEDQDLIQAYRWYWLGAQKRDPNAMMGLAVLQQAFTDEERMKADEGIPEMQNKLQEIKESNSVKK